ncbi:MAG: Rrf2 family transcriptional regulator [Candidatus Hydrogenedentes bacterium]|nr:Rrf2 family transcriptional regulator [Candidatus Hydrogenedentota bacterium]
MLTKTSEIAVQTLIILSRRNDITPVSPRELAAHLKASPTYMAKVTGLLVKANLLLAHRGVHGGVSLSRPTSQITLLEVVEACQGRILGDYCQDGASSKVVCAFHAAMLELHQAIIGTLGRWTVEDIEKKTLPSPPLRGLVRCKMSCIDSGAPVQHKKKEPVKP